MFHFPLFQLTIKLFQVLRYLSTNPLRIFDSLKLRAAKNSQAKVQSHRERNVHRILHMKILISHKTFPRALLRD